MKHELDTQLIIRLCIAGFFLGSLIGILIGGALFDPLLAVAFVRVLVSLSPILLTVGGGLVCKWLFRL